MLLARFLSQPVSKWVRNERVSWSPWGDIGMWPGSLICFLSFPLSFGFVSRHLGLRFCRALISLLFCPPPTCTKPSGSIGARTMQVSSGQVPVEGHRAGPSPPPQLACALGSQLSCPTSLGCLPSSYWLGSVGEEPHRRVEEQGSKYTFLLSMRGCHWLPNVFTLGSPPCNSATPSLGSFNHIFPHPSRPRGKTEAVGDFGTSLYSLWVAYLSPTSS